MRNNKTLVALIGLVITVIIVVAAVLILIIVLNENKDSVDDIKGKIILNPTAVVDSILPGEAKSVEIKADITNIISQDADAATEAQTLIWTIDNDKVATIQGNGDKAILTLKAAGNAVVTVTYKNISATCNVIVSELVPKITLSETNISETYIKGKTATVTLTAIPENIPELDESAGEDKASLKWKSDNEKVATVEANGNIASITLKSAGKAIITVSYGKVSAKCEVTAIEVNSKITLDKTSVSKTIISGKTQIVELTAVGENTNSKFIWTSNNTKVATVQGNNDKAVVTLKAGGTAIISVTDGNVSSKCTIKVTEKKQETTENKTPIIILDTTSIVNSIVKGKTKTETIVATTKNITGNLTWTSSNTKVATVTGSGKTATVTLVGQGTATITAKYGTTTATCKVTVTELVPKITLNKTNITAIESVTCTTQTITAITENIPGDIAWTSSNTNVAKVSGSGKDATITMCSGGTATITAKYGTTIATCKVTVLVPKITMNKTSIKVTDYPDTEDIVLTLKMENLEYEHISAIKWTSSNTNVAKVSGSGDIGIVDVCGRGTATITAISPIGNNVRATCTIKVEPKITLNKTALSETIIQGQTKQTTLSLTTENLNATQISAIQWKSDNEKVATVKGSGKTATVTYVGAGTANITAEHSVANKVTCKVTVTQITQRLTLSKESVTMDDLGSFTLTATVEPEGDTTWTSSNTNVAKITGTGNTRTITIVGSGAATIYVKYGSLTEYCDITASVPWLVFISSAESLTVGDERIVWLETVNITKGITWTSSNPSVVRVTPDGSKSGLIECLAEGTAVITAESGSAKDSITVKVSKP